MKTITNNFKAEIKSYGREFDDKITYGTTTLGQEDLNSITISYNSSLLKSQMKCLIIDSNVSIAVGTTLKYEIGLKVNGSYEYIDFGNFIVKEVEQQKDTNSYLITCFDKMLLAMKDVEHLNLTYPVTIRNYLSAICSHLGITFANASDSFTNYDKNVTSEHYMTYNSTSQVWESLGYTFRDILDDIAEATGSFIIINEDDELELKTFTQTNDTINEEYFNETNVNIGKLYGPINTIVLSRAEVDNIYYPTTLPQNPIEIKISNNPILEQTNREDFIQGIYNNLNGLQFYLNDFNTKGILYYELGDIYNVSIDNTTYQCLMLNDEISRTTGLKEYIYTDEPQTSVTEYKYASPTDRLEQTTRNAYIKADKAEGKVEAVVSAIGDDDGNVTSASLIMTINENNDSSIKLEADQLNLNGAVTANNNFHIKTDGSVEINDGSLYLNDTGSGGTAKLRLENTSWPNYESSADVYSNSLTFDYARKDNNDNVLEEMSAQYDCNAIYLNDKDYDNNYYRSGSMSAGGILLTKDDAQGNTTDMVEASAKSITVEKNYNGVWYPTFLVENNDSLDHSSYVYVDGRIQVTDQITAGTDVLATRDLLSDGGLVVSGPGNIGTDLTVEGTTTLGGDTTISGKLVIPKSMTYGLFDDSGKQLLSSLTNNNVVVNASGGTLFLGYQNTTALNFLTSKMILNADGIFVTDKPTNANANGKFKLVPWTSFRQFGTSGTQAYLQALLKWLVTTYPNQQNVVFVGGGEPGSRGSYMLHIYDTNDTDSNGFPQHSTGIWCSLDKSETIRFGTNSYTYKQSQLAVQTQLPSSGSNANGYYIRFPNLHLQICYFTKNLTTSSSTSSLATSGNVYYVQDTWTFPVAFSSAPIVTVGALDRASGVYGACSETPTTSNVVITAYGPASNRATGYSAVAIGPYS